MLTYLLSVVSLQRFQCLSCSRSFLLIQIISLRRCLISSLNYWFSPRISKSMSLFIVAPLGEVSCLPSKNLCHFVSLPFPPSSTGLCCLNQRIPNHLLNFSSVSNYLIRQYLCFVIVSSINQVSPQVFISHSQWFLSHKPAQRSAKRILTLKLTILSQEYQSYYLRFVLQSRSFQGDPQIFNHPTITLPFIA